jgi:mannose-6-phosphate isomerase-like protein (cupin superfamily)
MNTRKSTLVALALLATGAGLFSNAKAQDKSSSAVYIEHQKVEGSFKHALPIPDLFAGQSGGGHYRVRASRHDTPTEVEIHTLDTDIFYVTSGSATFVAGGTSADAKESSPNELRGKSIEGATTYQLNPGDLMIVPHGIPHQFQKITSAPAPFLYVEIKVR